jgi:hypothetical protein
LSRACAERKGIATTAEPDAMKWRRLILAVMASSLIFLEGI